MTEKKNCKRDEEEVDETKAEAVEEKPENGEQASGRWMR